MKQPSIVSSKHIPAANKIGNVKIAYQGKAKAAAPPASTSRPTSVAVSKPSPNRTPIGYIRHGLLTVFVAPARILFMKPRLFNCSSSDFSSYAPCRIRRNTLIMPIKITKLMIPMM